MNRVERGKDLNEQVEGFIEEMEAQLAQGHTEQFLEAMEFWRQFPSYSFGNALLIRHQMPTARQCAGFRYWQKLGYQVREGEHAIWVRAPHLVNETDEQTGEIGKRLVGFIAVPVFDVSQLTGDVALPDPFKPASNDDWEHLYICWGRRLRNTYGIEVKEQYLGDVYGVATDHSIYINTAYDVGQKAVTTLHELSHLVAKHHGSGKSKQQKELEAELSAWVLVRSLGATYDGARDYLIDYQIGPGELKGHLDTINQIVREVRVMLDWDYLTHSTPLEEAA